MNPKLTASNLARLIDSLPKNQYLNYPNQKTKTLIQIERVSLPEGPITIKRWNPSKGESYSEAKKVNISASALARLASSIQANLPINIDRVFGASYNSRSALEAMLLHTENFYICYPGRLERSGENSKVKQGHKHLIYCPDKPHQLGVIETLEVNNMVVSELDREVYFESLDLSKDALSKDVDINMVRRHAQIQIMLIKIAESLKLKSWVAKNDHAIEYNKKKLIEFDCVMKSLSDTPALQGYSNAAPSGELIDIIWFSDDEKKIPAIIEIEHSTGVTSGLTRMKGFMTEAPELAHMTFIIAAPDELQNQVRKKASAPQFQGLNIHFLPYSAIEDFYLLSRRKIVGIDNIKFFHTFLEKVSDDE